MIDETIPETIPTGGESEAAVIEIGPNLAEALKLIAIVASAAVMWWAMTRS